MVEREYRKATLGYSRYLLHGVGVEERKED
jgi:hypothetical protein